MNRIVLAVMLLACTAPNDALGDIFANIRIEVDDTSGHPINSIPLGGNFNLKMFATDVRTPPPTFEGVFAAYTDISYAASRVSVTGPIVHASFFQLSASGDTSTPGIIRGAGGAATSLSPPGNLEQLVLSVPLKAITGGSVTFAPSFDTALGHDVLLYGYDNAVLASEINFIPASLTIVPEPSSMVLMGGAFAALAYYGWRRRALTSG